MEQIIPIIKMTAAYSNAVLAVLLPKVSEFAQKIEAAPRPVTIGEVRRFFPATIPNDVGGQVLLRSGGSFDFKNGAIQRFDSGFSTLDMQNHENMSPFFGPVKLTQDQAVNFARNVLHRLGYTDEMLYTDLEPEVEPPWEFGTNALPRFVIKWIAPQRDDLSVRVEVNADSKRIEELAFFNGNVRGEPPKIDVTPEIVRPARSLPEHTPEEKTAFLLQALPKINEFARKLELAIRSPIAASDVTNIVSLEPNSYMPSATIALKNGFEFSVDENRVQGFCAPDAFFLGREIHVANFYGPWNLDENAAINLAIGTIEKLGYTRSEWKLNSAPKIRKPNPCVKNKIPRYLFSWMDHKKPYPDWISVHIEVDADSKTVKRLFMYRKEGKGSN